MNKNFGKVIEQLEKIKAMFNDSEVSTDAPTANIELAEVTLEDGTVLSYEGELAAGTALFVTDGEGNQIPAPEGTYMLSGEMAGMSLVVDAEGVIIEVIDERAADEPAAEEEALSKEDVETIVAEKMAAINDPLDAIVDAFKSLMSENENIKKELLSLKESFEAFKSEPVKNEEKKKFSRSENRRENYFLNKLNKK